MDNKVLDIVDARYNHEVLWASFISYTRTFWIDQIQMMLKDMEGCGIAINICITCTNVITTYLISQQLDNCWSQAKPVPGVPDKSLQSASKWRQTRLLSRWGRTLLPTRDFIGLLLKGCWWRQWHMIRVGLEQKRSQPNSNCLPLHHRMNWVLEGNSDCYAEAELGIGPEDLRNAFWINGTYVFVHMI